MKTIKPDDVAVVPAADVRPGMLTIEGVVLDVDRDGDHFFFSTPYTTIVADVEGEQQVLGKIDAEMVENIKAALAVAR